jgi:cytochrome P450
MVSIWSQHRNPRYWARPDDFDPDRWGSNAELHPMACIKPLMQLMDGMEGDIRGSGCS